MTEDAPVPGVLGGAEPHHPLVPDPPVGQRRASVPRPTRRAVLIWLALTAVAVALDGVVGGLALVVVAAVVLAGLSPRVLGALGTVSLLLVPLAIFIRGVPDGSEISPALVTRSLIPHHLTFAGLTFVSAGALIELWPHLEAWAASDHHHASEGPPLGTIAGVIVVAVVAVGAVLACVAVLQA